MTGPKGRTPLLTPKGVIGRIARLLGAAVGADWVADLAMKMDSDQETESYPFLGLPPVFELWKGSVRAQTLPEFQLQITNEEYSAALEILKKDFRRDKTGQITLQIQQFLQRVFSHWRKLLSTLILAGETTTCYDSSFFFAADHSEGKSGTQVNLLTKTQAAGLDVTTATAPTPDEFEIAILDCIAHMLTLLDNQGEPINEDALEFGVMVPPKLWPSAMKATRQSFLSTGSGVRDNVLTKTDTGERTFKVTASANPRLASWTTDFIIYRKDDPVKPFIIQEEVEPQLNALLDGSDHWVKNRSALYELETSRAAGVALWQGIAKATFE